MSDEYRIAHCSPRLDYLTDRAAIDAAVARVLESGWYILGEEVSAFEHEFGRYVGAGHCIGVASGTDAIHLALRALGIGRGAVVVAPAHTAVATVAAIELAGAQPVLCDIDAEMFTIDPNALQRILDQTADVAAVIAVHLYGHPADMTQLTQIVRERGLKLIEDCAQAIGAKWHGQSVGTFGDAAAFSFYPTKNLAACGDAGALVTNAAAVAQRARELRMYGWRERYVSEARGLNSRLDEIQAAILRAKLPRLEAANARRREIAARYRSGLTSSNLRLPGEMAGAHHVYHQFVVRTPEREQLRRALSDAQIGSAILYPLATHQQPAYRHLAVGGFPNAEKICRELLCLPMHPALNDADVDEVIATVNRWAAA